MLVFVVLINIRCVATLCLQNNTLNIVIKVSKQVSKCIRFIYDSLHVNSKLRLHVYNVHVSKKVTTFA